MVDSSMAVAVVVGKGCHGELASCHEQLLSSTAGCDLPSEERWLNVCENRQPLAHTDRWKITA